MLAERAALSAEVVRSAGHLIQQMLINSVEFASARIIALYAPIRNEVETSEVFEAAIVSGKRVLFPSVVGSDLVFRAVAGMGDMAPGAYGIREPHASCEAVNPCEAELIIIPGVVFDMYGRRIGYGKGYYDRALHVLERTGRLAGLGYHFQLVEKIEAQAHDVVMDLIVTERLVHYPLL